MKLTLFLLLLPLVSCQNPVSDFLSSVFGEESDGGVLDAVPFLPGREDQCNAETKCARDEICQGTPFGNLCVNRRMEPCEKDSECLVTKCFKPNGSTYGFCGGCVDTSNCTSTSTATKCVRPSEKWKYGVCVQCSQDSECRTGYYCDSSDAVFLEFLNEFQSIYTSVISTFTSASARSKRQAQPELSGERFLPTYTCRVQKTSGDKCNRDGQCRSGKCVKKTVFFFIKSRKGECS